MPLDVDYKVMTTFLEFYQVLLRFINFKLLGSEISFSVSSTIGVEYRSLIEEETTKKLAENKEYAYIFYYRYNIDEKFQDDEQVKQIQNK